MYLPTAFAEPDPAAALALVERYSFGTLISQHDGAPFASHLPMLLRPTMGSGRRLIGHMARENPQWQQAEGQRVLAIFAGPHAYVSPTWYESDRVVPTWNYVAVHLYGTFRAVHDEQAMMRIVAETVATYEAAMPVPWELDAGSEFNRRLIRAVVGFEVEVTRVEAKLKLNQNHPIERREKVVRALRATADPAAHDVADLMAETMRDKT